MVYYIDEVVKNLVEGVLNVCVEVVEMGIIIMRVN